MQTTTNFSPRPRQEQSTANKPTPLVPVSSTGRGEKTKTQPIPFDAIPPHDTEVERCVIGSMLMSPVAVEFAAEFLTPDHFYSPRNRGLFLKCLSVWRIRKALDETILVANMVAPNNTDELKQYVGRLIVDTPSAANIEGYTATLIKFLHERRRLAFALRIVADVLKSAGAPEPSSKYSNSK